MRQARRWCLVPAIVLLMCGSVALGFELEPCDDMYSDPEHPGTPPTTTELWCATYSGSGHFERIMVKFDQGELEAMMGGTSASSAALNLYRFFGCPNHPYTSVDVYAGSTDWDEDTWPFTEHLPHETTPVASYVFGPDSGWYEVDITDLVNSWLGGSRPNYGLVIQARDGEKWSKFYSKEYSVESQRPFLDVEPDWVNVPEARLAAVTLSSAPNPFNPAAVLSYALASGSDVTLQIYDVRGRVIRTLVSGYEPAGSHEVRWDGRDGNQRALPSGCYLAVLTAGEGCARSKLSLVK